MASLESHGKSRINMENVICDVKVEPIRKRLLKSIHSKINTIKQYLDFKVYLSLFLLSLVLIIFFIVKIFYSFSFFSMRENLTAEIFGSILDIFFLSVIFNLFLNWNERKRDIKRYMEEIDDYRKWDEKEAKYRLNGIIKRLLKLKVKQLNLDSCFLPGVSIDCAELEGSSFLCANLENASFYGSNLKGADFIGTNLNNADLAHTNLTGAHFWDAKCKGTDFFQSKLFNTSFDGAELKGAKFECVDFKGVTHNGVEQLSEVESLYGSINLGSEIESILKSKYPKLFICPFTDRYK